MNYLHFSIFNVELFDAIGCFLEESMLLTLRTGFELRIWGKGVYCATNICCLNKRGHLTATFYFYFDETFNVLTRQQSKQWSPFEEVARVNYASRVVIWGILKSGKTLEWVEINDCRTCQEFKFLVLFNDTWLLITIQGRARFINKPRGTLP